MCRRVTCSKCGKPTWAGCGAHVEQVLGNVAKDDRCRCRETANAAPEAGVKPPGASGGWLSRLLGR